MFTEKIQLRHGCHVLERLTSACSAYIKALQSSFTMLSSVSNSGCTVPLTRTFVFIQYNVLFVPLFWRISTRLHVSNLKATLAWITFVNPLILEKFFHHVNNVLMVKGLNLRDIVLDGIYVIVPELSLKVQSRFIIRVSSCFGRDCGP